ncbi:MAG TPA: hypothetical protein VEK76_10750 [Candidatus Binatia bacterium]|nr:hypothetical protein [Candidatus Binatia bacterium]
METMATAAVLPPEDEEVGGRIEVVTQRPIVLPRQDSPRARVEDLLGRHPWVLPGLLTGIIAMLLLTRGPRVVVVRTARGQQA